MSDSGKEQPPLTGLTGLCRLFVLDIMARQPPSAICCQGICDPYWRRQSVVDICSYRSAKCLEVGDVRFLQLFLPLFAVGLNVCYRPPSLAVGR